MKALCAFHNFLFMNLMEHGTYRSVDTKRIIPSKSVYYLVCEQLCCSRSNIYKIFSHSDINTMLLLKISVILHRNFFRYYSDTLGNIEKM